MMFFLFITSTGLNLAQSNVEARFGGECTGEKISVSKRLSLLIQRQKPKTELSCQENSCDDVFVYDLNGDQRPEYFIRLNCGGTGNCRWGVFSDRPAKMQGQFSAWFFYIHDKCSGKTRMPEKIIRSYLQNPYLYGEMTFCYACQAYVAMSEVKWEATNETLSDYFQRLKEQHGKP
jgi:hypothetical protein